MRPVSVTQTGVGTSAIIPLDWRANPFQVTLQTIIANAPTYSIEYTKDDVFSSVAPTNWTAVTGMSGATANAEATLVSPVTGIRINQTAGAAPNGVTLKIISGGP